MSQDAKESPANKKQPPAGPRRIVGVATDVDDEHVVPGAALTVYHPFGQIPDDDAGSKELPLFGGRLFVHTSMNPYALGHAHYAHRP